MSDGAVEALAAPAISRAATCAARGRRNRQAGTDAQPGGGPTNFDRVLCTCFGTKAVQLIADEQYGLMEAARPPEIVAGKIKDAIGRLRTVPLDCDIVQTARALGITFGD